MPSEDKFDQPIDDLVIGLCVPGIALSGVVLLGVAYTPDALTSREPCTLECQQDVRVVTTDFCIHGPNCQIPRHNSQDWSIPPLFLCPQFLCCVLDLYFVKHEEHTEVVRRLVILDFCLFSLRALLYALLGATDQAFLRALRSLRDGESPPVSESARSQEPQSTRPRNSTRFSFGGTALVRELDSDEVGYRPSEEARVPSVEVGSQQKDGEERHPDPERGEMAEVKDDGGIVCQI
ncbi:hypothetical protein DFH09DRAFT_1005183 [Mycena vulgaris]|nr:hypothetical protein DFH09DRAFT_1005183 [Mycena vulgaris]